MHVGFVDWKHVWDEMRLFRLKIFSNFSKCLFSIVKLKWPVNKILLYFAENAFIATTNNNPQIAIWNSEHWLQER